MYASSKSPSSPASFSRYLRKDGGKGGISLSHPWPWPPEVPPRRCAYCLDSNFRASFSTLHPKTWWAKVMASLKRWAA
eukprot:1810295-Amphidinium_carterae.1